jgi:flagellar hook-associated protein 3 FlgL
MRVTQMMMRDTMLRSLTRNASRLERLQEQITTGQKINRPSDDPVTAAAVMRIDSATAQADQHIANVDDALSWLGSTDQALSSIGGNIQRARELALSAPTSTVNAEGRDAIAKELTGLIDQVVSTGNATLAGQYIFGGQRTRSSAFDGSTSPPTYTGDSNSMVRIIDVGVTVQVNITGDQAIQPTLDALVEIRDAVMANDHTAIRAGIEALDAGHTKLLSAQSQVGARVNRLDAQKERLLDVKLTMATLRSQYQDVDMAEAISEFAVQDVVYKASLQAGAKAIQPSLIDYLR